MKLISLLEKIMPFGNTTIINIYSFLNKLIFIIVNTAGPSILIVGLITAFISRQKYITEYGEKIAIYDSSDLARQENAIYIIFVTLILMLVVNITYRFNKILLNKLK
jgi:hypothetical protein